MKQNRKHRSSALGVALVSLSLAGTAAAQTAPARHAGHTNHAPSPETPLAMQEQPQPAPDTTITLRSVGSDLEFLPNEIAVQQGKRLRIRYVNQGTFPHNIVVVKSEQDIDPLGAAAFSAGETGYIPTNMTDRMVAHSQLAPPGETIEFTFVVPAAGEYPFVCLYPGHYNMMVGALKALR